jgi:hypothetical protein
MGRLLGHRQTKGAETDKPDLLPPRHISTLPFSEVPRRVQTPFRMTEVGRKADTKAPFNLTPSGRSDLIYYS